MKGKEKAEEKMYTKNDRRVEEEKQKAGKPPKPPPQHFTLKLININ